MWKKITGIFKKGAKVIPYLVGLLIILFIILRKMKARADRDSLKHRLERAMQKKRAERWGAEADEKQREVEDLMAEMKTVDEKIMALDKSIRKRKGKDYASKDAEDSHNRLRDNWD